MKYNWICGHLDGIGTKSFTNFIGVTEFEWMFGSKPDNFVLINYTGLHKFFVFLYCKWQTYFRKCHSRQPLNRLKTTVRNAIVVNRSATKRYLVEIIVHEFDGWTEINFCCYRIEINRLTGNCRGTAQSDFDVQRIRIKRNKV